MKAERYNDKWNRMKEMSRNECKQRTLGAWIAEQNKMKERMKEKEWKKERKKERKKGRKKKKWK